MADSDFPLLIWIWVDAQLPPALCRWVDKPGKVEAVHISDLGLLTATDPEIFEKARSVGAIVLTKDQDFVQLQERQGAPPKIVWLTCGNLNNRELRQVLTACWPQALELLRAGEKLVEVKEGR